MLFSLRWPKLCKRQRSSKRDYLSCIKKISSSAIPCLQERKKRVFLRVLEFVQEFRSLFPKISLSHMTQSAIKSPSQGNSCSLLQIRDPPTTRGKLLRSLRKTWGSAGTLTRIRAEQRLLDQEDHPLKRMRTLIEKNQLQKRMGK